MVGGEHAPLTPWRFGSDWPAATLQSELAALADRPVSFAVAAPGALDLLHAAPGWIVEQFEAPLGQEPPGPPLVDGPFSRVRQAMCAYRFADPRITHGHFDPDSSLPGRDILVDVTAPLLRFLVGLRVGEVVDDVEVIRGEPQTRFGIRMDTLQGHLFHGSERVLVTKHHHTGAVRLRIEVQWRPGTLPAWWMGVGFRLFGRQIQARWRRQALRRLRAIAADPA